MANPLGLLTKGLRVVGGRGLLRFAGWVGAAVAAGEIGWFAAKKGKILERFTHYYCEEGPQTCGKMIPDDLVEAKLAAAKGKNRPIVVKCPHCPHGRKTVKPEEWSKMMTNRQKWQ